MESLFFFLIPFGVLVLYALIQTVRSISLSFKLQEEMPLNGLMIFLEISFTVIAPLLGFWRYDDFGPERPFAAQQLFTLQFITWASVIAYWTSRFAKHHLPNYANMLLMALIFQGFILNLVLIAHFGSWVMMGFIFPMLGFELVAPYLNLLFLGRELYNNHLHSKSANFLKIKHTTAGKVEKILAISSFPQKIALAFVGFLMFLSVEVGISMVFNQKPTALIEVFTNSIGFTFSTKHDKYERSGF